MNRRRLLIIIGIVVFVVIIAVVLYFVLNRNNQTTVTEGGVETPAVGSEDVRLRLSDEESFSGKTQQQKESEIKASQNPNRSDFEDVQVLTVRKVLDVPILGSTLANDGNGILYFDQRLGEFYRSSLDGGTQEQVTSRGSFTDLVDIKWANEKNAAILYFGTAEAKRLFAFNFSDQNFQNLGDEVSDAALSPDGSQIVYLFRNEQQGVSNISISNFDRSEWKVVKTYNNTTISLLWTAPFRFLASSEFTGYSENTLTSYNTQGEDPSVVIPGAYGLTYKASPDGNKLLYTVSSPRSSELFLFVTDLNGTFHKDLEISTFADKCAFAPDNITVYCAVPQQGNSDFVLPDDYKDGSFITDDSFFKINTETGEKERLGGANEFKTTYDASDVFVSNSGKTVYFTRRQDDRLYALIIP